MNVELAFLAGAVLVALLALLSPLVRAICWDALVHRRYRCIWERRGGQMRELKKATDYPSGGLSDG